MPRHGLSMPGAAALRRVRPIAPPSGFAFTPVFNIYRRGSTFTTDFNAVVLKPAYQATIYVSLSGDNNNDGLSVGAPLRSIRLAINRGNTLASANGYTGIRYVIAAGEYKLTNTQARAGQADNNGTWGDAWTATNPNHHVVIETTGGQVKNIGDLTMPAFASGGVGAGIYVSAYTSQSPSRSVYDKALISAYGRPTRLRPVLSVANAADPSAELNAMAALYGCGASYLDTTNKKLWIKLSDGRAPDSNVVCLGTGALLRMPAISSPQMYVENFDCWGGASPGTTVGGSAVLVTVGCGFFYSGGNGFAWTGNFDARIYNVNGYCCENDLDGWNYHGNASGVDDTTSPKFVEIGCIGDWNGWNGGGANNGSTCHEWTRGVRINGLYRNNTDRSIHDINKTMSWNLGCVSGPSISASASPKANWVAGLADGATEPTKMWLDACSSVDGGSDYDLYAWANAQIKYANMDVSGFANGGTGTIGTY